MTTPIATASPTTQQEKLPTIYRYGQMVWSAEELGADLSDTQVQQLLAQIYPELHNATARTENVTHDGTRCRQVTLERSVGTKGAAAWAPVAALPSLRLHVYTLALDLARGALDPEAVDRHTLHQAMDRADHAARAAQTLIRRLFPQRTQP